MSVKAHMVEQHVEEFIEMKGGEFGKYISTCSCNKKILFITGYSLLFCILVSQKIVPLPPLYWIFDFK